MLIGKPGPAKTHICLAHADRIEVRGHDLTGDLMGRLGFTEFFHLLLTGREPTEDERFFLDLVLVAIAEHGLTPSNIAARMTLAADPGSLQGAVAAGILGAGPVILGATEECALLLRDAQARSAVEVVRALHDAGNRVPGFGHPLHEPADPRAERIFALADERGISGPYVVLARELRIAVEDTWGKPLTQGDDEWIQFEATSEARPIVGGAGNIDTYSAPDFPGRPGFEGFTLRLFEPATGLWRIWWASSIGDGLLDEPVVGRFEDGVGIFECDEVIDGILLRVRYTWTVETWDSLRWQQSFSFDGGESWDTNWVMESTRTASHLPRVRRMVATQAA